MSERGMTAEELARRQASLRRDRALRRRFETQLSPDLPVDGDVPGFRVPVQRAGETMDSLLSEIEEVLREPNPFFDMLVEKWPAVSAGFSARPGYMEDSRLFLYVRTSGQLFALRSKLPALKKRLLALPGAPAKLTLSLKIHD